MADGVTGARPLRRDQAQALRERILAAARTVVESGDEPTMRGVAIAAQISERTVYRYFASREELAAALLPELRSRASAPMAADVGGLEDYARLLFTTFDRNAALARALVTARWTPRDKMRSDNLRALRAILDAAFPQAPRADLESAAASLRVTLSGASWAYLADCGMDLDASIRHVQWLVRTVLDRLRQLQRPGGRNARR